GRVRRGDVEAALGEATVRAAIAVETSFVEHAYIEPEAGYAVRRGDRIEVFATTQAPYMDREEVAAVLGILPEKVRILPSVCGGGFGGKLDVSVQPILAVAAWLLDRPVRTVWSRPESMAASTKRHPARIRAEAGADAEGRLTGVRFHGDFDTGAYASWGPTVAQRVPVHATGPYRVRAALCTTRGVYTNGPPAGAFRGFGVPQAAIAHEALMDILADRLGIDRLDFRLRNALRPGDRTHCGQELGEGVALVACLERLRPIWRRERERLARDGRGEGPLRRGLGVACMWYGLGNTSMSNPSTMEVGLSADGRLTLYNGAVDIGQGSATIMVQICAEALGLPVESFTQVLGDTARTRDAGKTSASRQTLVSGNAARLAGLDLRRRILRLANAGPDAVLALDGPVLRVTEDGRVREIDLSRLTADADGEVLRGIGSWDPPTEPLDADGQGVPYAAYGFAAQMALIEVDTELGTTRVLRIWAAHDVGRAVNPTLVEGQIEGGIAQGIGLALMEEFVPGRNENLHDYLIPTVGDVPEIEIHLIEEGDPLGPYGAKGVGEPALIPTAPAVLNAIADATGVRPTRVPVTPDRLLAALAAAKTRG
ncbi:MAG TPA: aldehyde oxidase, partial [Rhodospirillales bacterium]|nr:aldehyde oxidase [Rhodospirillales bacterium]